jgi:hypothetical protein
VKRASTHRPAFCCALSPPRARAGGPTPVVDRCPSAFEGEEKMTPTDPPAEVLDATVLLGADGTEMGKVGQEPRQRDRAAELGDREDRMVRDQRVG